MKSYLSHHLKYWKDGVTGSNPESFVFRPYGRLLKPEYGLDGLSHQRVLDFGCGNGGNTAFFVSEGFDVYGVDISEAHIAYCRKVMPEAAEKFLVIDPEPDTEDRWFGGNFDLVLAIQSLYYLSDTDLQARLTSLYNQMCPGRYIYATMMGTRCWYYQHSRPDKDGLRKVDSLPGGRLTVNCYINFTESREDLCSTFSLFEPLHIGYYDAVYREDEGSDFHYTFIGRRPVENKK